MICKDWKGTDINTEKTWGVYWYYPAYQTGSIYRKYKSQRRAEQAIGDFKKYYGENNDMFAVRIEYRLPEHTCKLPPNEFNKLPKEPKINWANIWEEVWQNALAIACIALWGLGAWKIIDFF
jgi:hypothetical protein